MVDAEKLIGSSVFDSIKNYATVEKSVVLSGTISTGNYKIFDVDFPDIRPEGAIVQAILRYDGAPNNGRSYIFNFRELQGQVYLTATGQPTTTSNIRPSLLYQIKGYGTPLVRARLVVDNNNGYAVNITPVTAYIKLAYFITPTGSYL